MAEDPRDELLAVAREIIEKRGYLGLSLRTAAAAAGVTPQVARRYYRNRDALFAAALRLPSDPATAIPTLVAPGLEGMGERLVRFTLDVLKDPQAREDLISLARTGAHAGHAALGIQEFLERGVIDRVARAIGVPDARMRSALISSYLLGIAMSRYVVHLEPLASASDEEVIRMVAPLIQDLLDPRKPIPGSTRAREADKEARATAVPSAGSPTVPPAAAGGAGRAGTTSPIPPRPSPVPPRPFDPDPGRSSGSSAQPTSAELIGSTATALSASALHLAANALKAASTAAAAARSGAIPEATSEPTAERRAEASSTAKAATQKPATRAPAKTPPTKAASARPTAKRAPAKRAATKATPAKATPAKATPAKATPARAAAVKSTAVKSTATSTPPKATPAKATSAKRASTPRTTPTRTAAAKRAAASSGPKTASGSSTRATGSARAKRTSAEPTSAAGSPGTGPRTDPAADGTETANGAQGT